MLDTSTDLSDIVARLPISQERGTVQAVAADGRYELQLFGAVGTDITLAGVTAALAAIPAASPLQITINSGGGSVFEGAAIYNALSGWAGPRTVVVQGIAASMASLIAMAGSEIVMPANAFMMVHSPFGMAEGRSDAIRNFADLLDKLNESMIAIYAARTGQPRSKIAAIMASETWFSAEEAVAAGFADRVADLAQITAAIDLSRFNPPPAARAALSGTVDLKGLKMQAAPTTTAEMIPATFAELQSISKRARLDSDWIVAQQAAGVTITAALDAAIDAAAARSTAPVNPANPGATNFGPAPGASQADSLPPMIRAMGEALACRMAGGTPSADARPFMGTPLVEMARASLDMRGDSSRWLSPNDVIDRAFARHSTSDFPDLLQNSGARVLMQAYQRAQSPLRGALARVREVTDFRTISVLRLGEAPRLTKVAEGGEVTHGTAAETKEGYKVSTFARIFALTREAIINDDLGAFADWARWIGAAAAETEASELVALLTANAGLGGNLVDGSPLFGAGRGNVGTGVINVANVGTGRAALRTTKGIDGVTPIAAEPRFLLCSPDGETAADGVVTAITPNSASSVNPFAAGAGGALQKLCEPRLSGAPWYLFAGPESAPVIEVAYLAGKLGPDLQIKDGWDTLGVEMRAVLDFGAGLVGWRGAYRSTGA